ncbi:uncharacterized protein C2845_PM05G31710 [Panicum miliaceum]|uniref:DUF4005 domain-containing protein n=1 Tax=Panicum miliaceum TaxID=4540 RepID=A0A3L6STW6_PANMI|nr:uncharacterized protein C2845_PM05G31710 [Panicum miliaceum]
MGRAMRWLMKVLTGTKKKAEGGRKEQHNAACAGGGLGLGPPPVEKRRWSFAKPRHSVADGGRRPSVTAVAAGELSQVRPCNCGLEREAEAAVVIQKAFRGYLARKALRALKSLVKLQALVRGYLVRKQAATTLRRLQALMRLQAKTASSRKSVEQERIVARAKPVTLPAVHRRRLSDGGDNGFDRSPRIVEMDTCQLRCRSSRITSRYAADPPGASPLLYFLKPASRLQGQEPEPPHPKTTHNTPRLGAFPGGYLGSPAAKLGRGATCRDTGSSPRYMADTASSVARTRCQSAPRQRQGEHAAAQGQAVEPRPSVGRRKQAPDSFSFKSSEASRVEDSELSDEVTRDYYLDRLW